LRKGKVRRGRATIEKPREREKSDSKREDRERERKTRGKTNRGKTVEEIAGKRAAHQNLRLCIQQTRRGEQSVGNYE